jgi:hypothetical protein
VNTIVITLTPIESRRLLAKAVAAMPAVQRALQGGRLIVSLGTTNAYILEELTGRPVDKGTFTAGVITSGVLCLTDPATRQSPVCFVQGQQSDKPWLEVLSEFTAEDVFIKGANALDLQGNAGILLGGKQGGTIGQAMGLLAAVGAHLVIPVGLEKLIPDVPAAAMAMGQGKMSGQWGMPCGLYVVSTGEVVTEVDALQMLFDVGATVVAAGGVAGSEGAITLAVQGEQSTLSQVDLLVSQLKRERSFTVQKRACAECPEPCARNH